MKKLHRAKFMFAVAASLFIAGYSSAALASENAISDERLNSFDISGVKLAMSLDEVEALLEEKGYAPREGSKRKTFDGLNGPIFLETYKDESDVERVWSIEYTQRWNGKQDVTIWKERMLQRYGEPVRIDEDKDGKGDIMRANMHYSVKPLPDAKVRARDCDTTYGLPFSKDPDCSNLDSLNRHFVKSMVALKVSVREYDVSVFLVDSRLFDAAHEREKKKAAEAVKENSKNTEVNF